MYRVRKTWEDSKSQIGAYSNLENAKEACDKAGKGYEVYNSNGVAIYPTPPAETEIEENNSPKQNFKVGASVTLVKGAKYASGMAVPEWLIGMELYVREIYKDGDIVISTQKKGAITGAVNPKYLSPYVKKAPSKNQIQKPADNFTPYIVSVETNVLNVRTGAGTNYKIAT